MKVLLLLLVLLLGSLGLISGVSVAELYAQSPGLNCTVESSSCSFKFTSGACCVTVASIPDTAPKRSDRVPNYVPTGSNCGVKWTSLLFIPCAKKLTTKKCGSGVVPDCQ